jgi:hypothetical protein
MSTSGPLYPQKRTSELTRGMSALCQKRTHALQQFFIVIRSPGGAANQRKRYARAECLSGFQMKRWKNFYPQELQV